MSTIANKLHRNRRRAFIESYEFSTALRNKLVEELGTAHRADIALDGLRAWYLACLYADGELIGMPSKLVDVAWHEMILRTREYAEFCRRAFGAVPAPHARLDPRRADVDDPPGDPADRRGARPPDGAVHRRRRRRLDDGYEWSSVDLRRMRDRYDGPRRAGARGRGAAGAPGSGGGAGGGYSGGFAGWGGDGGGGHHGGGDGGGGCGVAVGGGGCGGGGSACGASARPAASADRAQRAHARVARCQLAAARPSCFTLARPESDDSLEAEQVPGAVARRAT